MALNTLAKILRFQKPSSRIGVFEIFAILYKYGTWVNAISIFIAL